MRCTSEEIERSFSVTRALIHRLHGLERQLNSHRGGALFASVFAVPSEFSHGPLLSRTGAPEVDATVEIRGAAST
jgi:hypothetical protein